MAAKGKAAAQSRLREFERRRPRDGNPVAVRIKVSAWSGCFHREHSPRAYELIDAELGQLTPDTAVLFEEHESGPELLTYLKDGLALAKGIVDFVFAIINARAKGIKKGDPQKGSITLTVRRVDDGSAVREETILHIEGLESVSKELIGEHLGEALRRLIK